MVIRIPCDLRAACQPLAAGADPVERIAAHRNVTSYPQVPFSRTSLPHGRNLKKAHWHSAPRLFHNSCSAQLVPFSLEAVPALSTLAGAGEGRTSWGTLASDARL